MATDPAPLVQVHTTHGVTTLTLDSPHNRNALSTPLMTELLAALAAAVSDADVRMVVLSHTGPVFCSGADLKETAAAYASGAAQTDPGRSTAGSAALRPLTAGMPASMLGDVLTAIWRCPKPMVARVGGPARAGGLGLIAAADLAVCAEDATFAFTEVRLGVVPAVISATVLRRLHPRAAAELYLTGEIFDGRRAAQIGLVTAAVPTASLDARVADYCAAIVRGAPGALAGVKDLLRRSPATTFGEEITALADLSTHYFLSEEGREGVSAFREKRLPKWCPSD